MSAIDWAGVIPVTQGNVDRLGLSDRIQCIARDLFTSDFGTGYDLATLGHILHSEGENRSRHLLQKVFEALVSGGTIAIAEWLMNNDRTSPVNAAIFAVNMLVNSEEGDTFSFDCGGSCRLLT